jgi:hypothetical protein
MKKINIVIASLCILLLNACADWLDMPSENKFDSVTVFQSVSKAEMAVLGTYNAAIAQEMYYQLLSGTDECMSVELNNSKGIFARYAYDPSNSAGNSTYAAMYSAIEQANNCIKGLSAMTASTEEEQIIIDRLLGESLALRAYAYFHVVRLFGDVPFSLVPTADAPSITTGRHDRDEIYDQCVTDLQEAIELLPWKAEGNIPSERISKQAAYGILARVALHAAGYSLRFDLETYSPSSIQLTRRADAARVTQLYTIARDACKAVMDKGENDLLAEYDKVWRDLLCKRYNSESIFEHGMYGPKHNDIRLGYTTGIPTPASNVPYGRGAPQVAAMPTLYFDYDDNDQRRDVTICNYEIRTNNNVATMVPYSSRSIGKYRATWKHERGSSDSRRDINAPILRFSDILLMFAEAENELNNGPTAAATSAYERVRLRAFKGDETRIGTTPTTKEAFFEAIVLERKREFAFESIRRGDIVRWGIQYETLMNERAKLIRMANQEGEYAEIPRYVAYSTVTMTSLEEPHIGLPIHATYVNEPDQATKDELATNGYTLIDLYAANTGGFFANALDANLSWVQSFFDGLTKNKTELLPLHNNMMNDNPELREQQHPLYR